VVIRIAAKTSIELRQVNGLFNFGLRKKHDWCRCYHVGSCGVFRFAYVFNG
jgi:hypothetical protein